MACACVVLDSWVSSSSTEHGITAKCRRHANHVCWWETVTHCCGSFLTPLTEGTQTLRPILPSPNTNTVINLISFMCASCHVSAVCLCRQQQQQHSSRYSAKRGGEKRRTFFFAQEKKSLRVDYASPARWYHQISVDGEKRKGGCKKDGTQARKRKAAFDWVGICFNASVMAEDGLNPPAGWLWSLFFSLKVSNEINSCDD